MPLFSIVLANVLDILINPASPKFREDSDFYSLMFLVLALAAAIFYSLLLWLYSLLSERLTERLRIEVFRKFLRMHIGWHDDP